MIRLLELILLFTIAMVMFVYLTTCTNTFTTINFILIMVALMVVLILLKTRLSKEHPPEEPLVETYAEKKKANSKRSRHPEKFQTNTQPSTMTRTTSTSKEDVTQLPQSNLQVHISSFDTKSYSGQGKDVQNISPLASARNGKFTFDEAPTFTTHTGFSLHNNHLHGPLSMDLGILGNKPYSISWFMQLNEIEASDVPLPIFNVRANTMKNIGLSVRLRRVSASEVQIHVQHSDDETLIYTNNSFTDPFIIMDKQFHLFTLVRDTDKIQLYVDDFNAPILDGKIQDNNVLFSNKEMEINPTKKLNMNLALFAIYNASLSVNEISTIYRYVQSEVVRKTGAWESLNEKYMDLVNTMEQERKCGFQDYEICHSKCAAVKDWSDHVTILKTATDDCIRSIIKQCNKPSEREKEYCGLWNKAVLDRIKGLAETTTKPKTAPKKQTRKKQTVDAKPPNHDGNLRVVTAYPSTPFDGSSERELSLAEIEALLQQYRAQAAVGSTQVPPAPAAPPTTEPPKTPLTNVTALYQADPLVQTVIENQKNKGFFERMLSNFF